MLTMKKIYDVLCENTGKLKMTREEFFSCFIPDDFRSAQILQDELENNISYKSAFFNGNMKRRGLKHKIEAIILELRKDPDHYIREITAAASKFLESYGIYSNKSIFEKCLDDWKRDIDEDSDLKRYVEKRADNPDSYADILAVLFLYAILLWKKDSYKNLMNYFQNGVSKEWNFDLERAEVYASCGKEKTIFKTNIIEKNGIKWLDVGVNFAPLFVRQEIPSWASVVFKMRPPRDIRYFRSIEFQIAPIPKTETDAIVNDCGIRQIVVEIKPENREEIRHYAYTVDLKNGQQTITIPLQEVNWEILAHFQELCFVVKLDDLSALESEDMTQLNGQFRIAQIRLN